MPHFNDPHFGFSVDVPEHWKFLPSAWSPIQKMKQRLGQDEWIRLASAPFCCAMAHHDSDRHAYPTLQVTARPFPVPGNKQAQELLHAQLRGLREQHPDFKAEWSSHEAIVSGFRANMIRGCFVLAIRRDEEVLELGVISRSYTVFAPGVAFAVGLSSSDDPSYFCEADFRAVIASVRIGTSRPAPKP